MSGRKQHYIPQIVLRAFEAARTGTKSQVFVFRKGRPEYLTSTEGAAAERDFYSQPSSDGSSSLDDAITEFEGVHLTPILREIRLSDSGMVDPELAAVAVAHLAVRTAHLRDSMSMMTEDALAQIQAMMDDSNALRKFAGLDSFSEDSELGKRIRSDLATLVPESTPEKGRKALERLVVFRLRERSDFIIAQAEGPMRAGLEMFQNTLRDLGPKAHAKALSQSLKPQSRVDELRKMTWQVVKANTEAQHFILPDCVVAARTASSDELEPFAMLSSSEAAVVVMPLSSEMILIGSLGNANCSLGKVNSQLARSSLDFFVSSKRDEATCKLSVEIGSCASELKVDWLDEDSDLAADDAVLASRTAAVQKIRTPTGKVGDAMKRALAQIVEEVVDAPTLDRIDLIVVPANMSAAMESVWKRAPTSLELQQCQFGTVEPIKVGSVWKCRIILPRVWGERLTRDSNPVEKLAAARVAKFNLGRAYYFDCLTRRVPTAFEALNTEPWNQVVLPAMARIASAYFGGLASARHEDESLHCNDALQQLALTLRGALASLWQLRERYLVDQKLDQLVPDSLRIIFALMTTMAEVCGLLEAKNTRIARESQAGTILEDAGLWDWHLLFSKDLRRHYETRHRWSSEADLYQLCGHVERILWTIGVFVSPVPGDHWIDVLNDVQLADLSRTLRA